MAGRGPAAKPPATRRRTNKPVRGEWKATPGIGWQHGKIPAPPDGLMAASRTAWSTWMKAWFASHWTPADLPGLRRVILHYDQVERGRNGANDLTAMTRLMDTYGITPKGQQDRRWAPVEEPPAPPSSADAPPSQYGHLKVVAT